MPKGGKRAGAGRKSGTPNKRTITEMLEIKALAQQFAPDAMTRLAFLAQKAESEAASVAACNSILDRAYGKPSQIVGSDPDNPLPEMPRVIEHIYIDPAKT
jgi:hypothetical protein